MAFRKNQISVCYFTFYPTRVLWGDTHLHTTNSLDAHTAGVTLDVEHAHASGYAAVWATENTRAAIWDAMARGEVHATVGPRMTMRFFGGWEFSEDDASFQMLAEQYAKGVPMGGTLHNGTEGKAPKQSNGNVSRSRPGNSTELPAERKIGWRFRQTCNTAHITTDWDVDHEHQDGSAG